MSYNVTINPEIIDSGDVVVVGGGPSGVAAAISASRCGKKVILIESSSQLGGMATLASVAIFMVVGNFTGIYEEMMTEFIPEQVEIAKNNKDKWNYAFQFNPILFRHYLNKKVDKENVNVYFQTSFVKAIVEGGQVKAIIVNTREGLKTIEAKCFIDCTGDGRVAIDAGAEYKTGREEDGLTQPVTLMFQMENTNKPVKRQLPEDCYIYESVEELPQGRLLKWEKDGTLLVNMTRFRANGAKVEDINAMEKECLRQVLSVADYLQRNGHETYKLVNVASQTGVRETNQIMGLYELNVDDLINSRKQPDLVAQTNYDIDIHNPTGGNTCDIRHINSYDIPYRCLVPKGLEGILVSGRAISATHEAMSSIRVMPTCFALGQAAGIACALAIEEDCSLADIPIAKLHKIMEEQGVRFGEYLDV